MKLESISVTGLPAFDQFELKPLADVTCIVGPNASGKTTTLEAINSVLTFLARRVVVAPALDGADSWLSWRSADLKLGGNGPMNDAFGKPMTQLRLRVEATEHGQVMISVIETDENKLAIDPGADEKPHLTSVDVADLRNQLEQATQAETAARERAQDNSQPTRQLYQEASQRRSQVQALLQKAEKSTLPCMHNSERSSIPRAQLEAWLSKIPLPAPRYIRRTEEPSRVLQQYIARLYDLKNGRWHEKQAHAEAMARMHAFLEQHVYLFYDKRRSTPDISVDESQPERVSAGTRICLQYFALTDELKRPSLVLWDEPENGLHATRRHKLLNHMLSDDLQFVVATHATELAPVTRVGCSVFRARSRFNEQRVQLELQGVAGRLAAFQLLEDLGVYASSTLFTANVLIWVEGPSDAVFWRHWLSRQPDLEEGYDYTFAFFGGSNLKSLSAEETTALVNLLAVCSHPLIIVDSDCDSELDDVKPHVRRLRGEESRINAEGEERMRVEVSLGREVENYLPGPAIRHALERLGYDKPEYFDTFELQPLERCFERIEEVIRENDSELAADSKPKGHSVWTQKPRFMRAALDYKAGDFQRDLRCEAPDLVADLARWIRLRRPERPALPDRSGR